MSTTNTSSNFFILLGVVCEFGMVFDIIGDGFGKISVSTPAAASATTITCAIASSSRNFDALFAPLCAAVQEAIGVVMRFSSVSS